MVTLEPLPFPVASLTYRAWRVEVRGSGFKGWGLATGDEPFETACRVGVCAGESITPVPSPRPVVKRDWRVERESVCVRERQRKRERQRQRIKREGERESDR